MGADTPDDLKVHTYCIPSYILFNFSAAVDYTKLLRSVTYPKVSVRLYNCTHRYQVHR